MIGSDKVIEVSELTFDAEVIQRSLETPVLVDFWAPWCGPCRQLGPLLEKLAHEPESGFILAKVNADQNPNLVRTYGIQGIPAVKAFRQGQLVKEFVGAKPEPFVRQFIQEIAPNPLEQQLTQARSLMIIQRWDEAEAIYRDILDEKPESSEANLGLAQALLYQGIGCPAQVHLRKVRDGVAYVQAEKLLPLASFMCDSLTWDEENATDLDRLYWRSAELWEKGNIAAALDGLIEVLRQDKRYRKGAVRPLLLAVFALLGDDHDLTQQYRQEMASVLF